MANKDRADELAGFEEFNAIARPDRIGPGEVSLTKTNITLAPDLADAVSSGKYGRVLISFNQEQRTVAIRPTDAEESGYKLSYRSVASQAFYKHFEIRERGRFQGFMKNGVLMIPLDGEEHERDT